MILKDLLGRHKEKGIFLERMASNKSEFLAFYGRRRVGKTFLIREYFNYTFDFQLTGLGNADTSQQLFNFYNAYNRQANQPLISIPKNWIEVFEHLKDHVELIKGEQKKVIFLDEIPWMDTPKSDFMTGLEGFWNGWAAGRKDIMLIVCGSAASWMINELINNHGGLHNRVTKEVKVNPFTLTETEEYLKSQGHICTRYQILQLYMVTGGIPFYLERARPELSILQNIDELCFHKGSLLKTEFAHVFKSLFKKYHRHEKIVETLATKVSGMTRNQIIAKSELKTGGTFSNVLEELELSGFISKHVPIDKKAKDTIYRLCDFYSLFYFKFIKNNPIPEQDYWVKRIDDPAHRAWSGYAFEQVCLAHENSIKAALGISGISTEIGSWKGKNEDSGAQIDMLIDRKDGVINICEMKYSINEYTITKDYATKLRNKIGVFRSSTKTKKAVQLAMITTYGLKKNEYSNELVVKEVTMDDLFDR